MKVRLTVECQGGPYEVEAEADTGIADNPVVLYWKMLELTSRCEKEIGRRLMADGKGRLDENNADS
jgi:hypothetical protein